MMSVTNYCQWIKELKVGDTVGMLTDGESLTQIPKILAIVQDDGLDGFVIKYNNSFWQIPPSTHVETIYKECNRNKKVWYQTGSNPWFNEQVMEFLITPINGLVI